MHDFLLLVLDLLRQGITLAILAATLCAVGLAAAAFLYRHATKGQKRFPWGKALLLLLLVGYLAMLAYATLLRYTGGGYQYRNLHLFRAWREAWNNFSLQLWLNVLLNVALFMPLGFLLPLLAKVWRKWYILLITGFGASLIIELVQFFTGRGLFDVDDLFTNTLGAVLGFCVVMIFITAFGRARKGWAACIAYAIVPIAFAVILSGIFVSYHMQEYGNLPSAPAFAVNTEDIEWELACQLSDTQQTAPTYYVEPFDKESCVEFGDEFAEKLGITFQDVSYYDSSAIFANHSTGDFLYVSYLDGSYQYSVGGIDYDLEGAEVDQETLRELLEPYELTIPDTAEFRYEGDGVHTFTVNMELIGNTLLNGTLRCRCLEGGTLEELDNQLITYSFYKEAELISQSEAYELLCNGNFSNGDRFEYYAPECVTIQSCRLEYSIDTKGFYQPVYVFAVTLDESDSTEVMIPAMKG